MATRKRKRGEGSVSMRGNDGVWYFMHSYQTPDGRVRITKCLGKLPNEEAAWEAARKIKREIQPEIVKRERDHRIGGPKYKTVTCDPLLTQYIEDLRRRNSTSLYTIERTIESRLRPFFGKMKVFELKTKDFDRYRKERVEQDEVTNNTVDHHLAYLQAALKLEHDKKPHTSVPVMPTIPKSGEDNVRQNFLEFDGYQKVLAALPISLKLLFVIGWHLGNRKGVLLDLKWSQIEATRIRFLNKQHTKPVPIFGPIYGDISEYLERQRAVRDRLYPKCENVFFWHKEDCGINATHGGFRATAGSPIVDFRGSWTKAITAAGYPDLLFHDLRRSAVRNLVEEVGLSEKRAMAISGHRTSSMLQRYNIINPADVDASGKQMENWIQRKHAAATAKAEEIVKVEVEMPVKAKAVKAVAKPDTDVLSQLERYADLLKRELIDEAEFKELKARLLAKTRP